MLEKPLPKKTFMNLFLNGLPRSCDMMTHLINNSTLLPNFDKCIIKLNKAKGLNIRIQHLGEIEEINYITDPNCGRG